MIGGGVKTEPHCDFCNDTRIRWRFHARRSVVPAHKNPVPIGYLEMSDHPSDTDWAACDECKELIVAGKRDELVDRALTSPHSQWVQYAKTLPRTERRKLRQMVRTLHDTFWKNREGPPTEVTP